MTFAGVSAPSSCQRGMIDFTGAVKDTHPLGYLVLYLISKAPSIPVKTLIP